MQFPLPGLLAFAPIRAAVAAAAPGAADALDKRVNLFNGAAVVAVPLAGSDEPALAARADTNCKGSSLCSNSQSFKNACQTAYSRIEDTTYTSGGAKSGICDGHCGLFVQGSGCSVNGASLANGYNLIRAGGCQACGSLDMGGGCLVTINYVSSC